MAAVNKEKGEPRKKEEGNGLVKAVPSGDTVILILQSPGGGPPPEREITFSSLVAPRLARFRGAKDDEPFAWQSREFLRQKVIGKVLRFSIEYTSEGANRVFSYGTLYLGEEVLNETVVSAGWCRVKVQPGKPLRGEQQQLLDLSNQAEAEGRGVFNKVEAETSVRKITNLSGTALQKLQGHAVPGVVESVRDGTSLRVVIKLKDQWFEPLISLAGAQAPGFKFDQATQELKPEPFAREAKFLVERLLLHRDVQVTIQGVDKQENVYGTVLFNGKNICEELIKSGLAHLVHWNAPQSSLESWKALESAAKAQHLRIWKDETVQVKKVVPTTSHTGTTVGSQFTGTVREVLSGGSVVVQIGTENRTLHLSSVVVPRFLTVKEKEREPKKDDEPYSFEAKEFLRNRLIGKEVTCTLDYIRGKVEKKADKPELPEKSFYSVFYDNNVNVAVKMVEEGLATVTNHWKDDPRSPHYDLLLQAEAKAKSKSKGVHGKDIPTKALDLTKDPTGAKRRFAFFERAGRQTAIIEYVFNPTRFRVYIPKERVFVNFALSALRAPEDEALLAKTIEWAREKMHQREVEILVESQDRGGTFLGYLFLKKKNLALTLVEMGYASLYEPMAGRVLQSVELHHAQEDAKKHKKGMWVNYDPELEKKKQLAEEEARAAGNKKEMVTITVTEVVDGSWFYAHILGEEHTKFEELTKEIAATEPGLVDPASLKKGTLVLAQFAGDGGWYRARIEGQVDGAYKVTFIDYGNMDVIELPSIRKLEPKFATLPPHAKECYLAYIKTPTLDDDYGKDAAVFFKEMVWGKPVVASVEYREGNAYYLTIGDPDSKVHVNAALLFQGLARVDKSFKNSNLYAKLKEEEDKAKKNFIGIWRHGDDDDDDDY